MLHHGLGVLWAALEAMFLSTTWEATKVMPLVATVLSTDFATMFHIVGEAQFLASDFRVHSPQLFGQGGTPLFPFAFAFRILVLSAALTAVIATIGSLQLLDVVLQLFHLL